MRLLLDTHALFWWFFFPELLPHKIRQLLVDPDVAISTSAVSAYEMSYKHHRDRWPEVEPLVNGFEEAVAGEGFSLLSLTAEHAIRAGAYGAEHRDPFDRMLSAQAVVEGLTLVSKDRSLADLGADVIW